MTANSLSVESRELGSFNAAEQNGRVEMSGSYNVTIKNTGFLPIPNVTHRVGSASIPSANIELISSETAQVGTLSPRQSSEVSIDFNASGSRQELSEFLSDVCRESDTELDVKEQPTGVILAVAIDDSVDVSVGSASCNIGRRQPSPDPTPAPPQEPAPEPDPEPAPEPEPEPEPDPEPEPQELQIETRDSPTQDGGGSWAVIPDDVGPYRWDMGDGTTKEGEVVGHLYDSNGTYTIIVESSDGRRTTTTAEVTGISDGGGGAAGGTGGVEDFAINGPNFLEAGEQGQWSALPADAAPSWRWVPGDTTEFNLPDNNTDATFTYTYDNPGNWRIVLEAYDQNGQVVERENMLIEVVESSTSTLPSMSQAAEMKNSQY